MGNAAGETDRGPQGYQNWLAWRRGDVSLGVFEFPLFSDRVFVGQIRGGCGFFEVIHLV